MIHVRIEQLAHSLEVVESNELEGVWHPDKWPSFCTTFLTGET